MEELVIQLDLKYLNKEFFCKEFFCKDRLERTLSCAMDTY